MFGSGEIPGRMDPGDSEGFSAVIGSHVKMSTCDEFVEITTLNVFGSLPDLIAWLNLIELVNVG